MDDDHLDEWCHATEHRKLLICWGSFRHFRLLHPEPSDTSWEPLCSLDKAISAVLAGDDRMRNILASLCPVRLSTFLDQETSCPDTS
jgi:hypothetical protein